jgi:hypothetical protein
MANIWQKTKRCGIFFVKNTKIIPHIDYQAVM